MDGFLIRALGLVLPEVEGKEKKAARLFSSIHLSAAFHPLFFAYAGFPRDVVD